MEGDISTLGRVGPAFDDNRLSWRSLHPVLGVPSKIDRLCHRRDKHRAGIAKIGTHSLLANLFWVDNRLVIVNLLACRSSDPLCRYNLFPIPLAIL